MYRLIEVVHAKHGEGHLFLILDVLLCQEVLVSEELILVFVASLVQLVVVVEVLGEDDVEGAVVIIVLHQLVSFDHLLLKVGQIVFEELKIRVAERL